MLYFVGAGFSAADYTGASVVKYKQDGLFDEPVDSGAITYTVWQQDSSAPSDTASINVKFSNGNSTPNEIPPLFDYIVRFPAAARADTIKNIVLSGHTSQTFTYSRIYNDKPFICYNYIVSYTHNDSACTPAQAPGVEIMLIK